MLPQNSRGSRPRFCVAVGDLGRAPEDLALLRDNRDLGVTGMTVRLPPAKEEETLPILDRGEKLITQVRGYAFSQTRLRKSGPFGAV